ncbi:alpha/beta fold hydrolase [Mycobacteroides salmoniphilum]|uniref:alpha/beta fold hydrolase n=1 Tax=Mycobacteroides salmoniphilum TaxID=404941 RepID=UPI001F361C5B|nr:alpha/beta fold hydrolase [Mycobacteroides salmoniphilum]
MAALDERGALGRSFNAAGFDPILAEWTGVPATLTAARQQPEAQAGVDLAEISAHHAALIKTLPVKPILVGHSVGGFIVQHLLGQDLGSAAVAICPGQIKGVKAIGPAQARSTMAFLSDPRNLHRTVSLDQKQFRYAFAHAVSQEESDSLFERWRFRARRGHCSSSRSATSRRIPLQP